MVPDECVVDLQRPFASLLPGGIPLLVECLQIAPVRTQCHQLLFEFPFRSRVYESVVGATPVVAGSRVFLTASYNTGTAALDFKKDGGFEVVWSRRRFGVRGTTSSTAESPVTSSPRTLLGS